MTLKEKFDSDFLNAYKTHDELRVSVLRMLKSSIKNAEIAQKETLSDQAIIAVIKKEIKQRNDSVESYQKVGSNDAAQKETAEIKILEAYLPEQLNDEEINRIIKESIKNLDAKDIKDMGRVISDIMKNYGDKVDGKIVSNKVRITLLK